LTSKSLLCGGSLGKRLRAAAFGDPRITIDEAEGRDADKCRAVDHSRRDDRNRTVGLHYDAGKGRRRTAAGGSLISFGKRTI